MRGHPRQPLHEKFWRYVEPEPNSGCWLWVGAVGGNVPKWGYGKIKHEGKQISAHRVSWELHHGPISPEILVLHKCDVTICVNPGHLFLGSHRDNAVDRSNKDRGNNSGELSKQSKLKSSQVLSILDDPRDALTLSNEYGVSRDAIYAIRKGKAWIKTIAKAKRSHEAKP